jgi:hypothetical protein
VNRVLAIIFWGSLAAGAGVYAAMVGWSLPIIQSGAAGLVPFDLRPAGYSAAEAQAFMDALTPEARALYLGRQHWLDTVYPGLLGLMLFSGIAMLAPSRWRWVLGLTSVPGTVSDWIENLLVARMLRQEGQLPAELVDAASLATVIKSVCTTVALVLLLLLFLAWLYRKWRRNSPETRP